MKHRKPYKIPETITEEELIKILKATKQPHHKLAFALGFYEAMRISEVVNLKIEDINFQTKLIHIKQAKGSKDRMIPIAPEVLRGLKKLPINCGIRALQIAFKNISKKVLGKDLHFHCLRHSGISHYINEKKWQTPHVQRLAGHSRIQTTEVYIHVKPQYLINQMWGEK